MAFNIDTIKKYTKSKEEYDNAVNFVNSNNVRLFPNRSIFKGEDSVSCEITEYEEVIKASFT